MKENNWREEIEKKLDEWLETTDHRYNCAAENEGLYCCLDRIEGKELYGGKGREKILELFETAIASVREETERGALEKVNDGESETWYPCSGCSEDVVTKGDRFCHNCDRKLVFP